MLDDSQRRAHLRTVEGKPLLARGDCRFLGEEKEIMGMREAGKTGNRYEGFAKSDLILRDQLAIDRTLLANERTVLAYIRTG